MFVSVNLPRLARVVVAASLASSFGTAWAYPDDPMTNLGVAVKPESQTVQKAATLGDGTTWVAWWDTADGAGFRLYAQLLTPWGEKVFPEAGLLVSDAPQSTSLVDWDLRVDDAGNAVMVFTDTRDGDDRDVHAHLVSQDGDKLWGADGVTLSVNDDFEADPRVCQDLATGEYHFVWVRSDASRGLYYQRLNAAGVAQEAAGGIRIAGDGVEGPAFASVEPAPGGGFVMVYARDTRTFQSPRHVYAQKHGTGGEPLWNGGAPVVISDAASLPIAQFPRVIIAPDGGAAFAWSDFRAGSLSNAFAQRVNASGIAQFAADGVAVSNRAGRQQFDPAIEFIDDTLQLLVFFNDRSANQALRAIGAQLFNASGQPQFSSFGTDVLPFNNQNKSAPRSVKVGGGAVLVATQEPGSSAGNFNAEVVAVRVDDRAGSVWLGGFRVLSNAPSLKSRLLATVDDHEITRAFWEDQRNDSGDIYAQNINPDGTLGIDPPCPGDTNGDNAVNFADLNTVLGGFGQTAPGLPGDVNNDGVVNFGDLNLVLSLFGTSCK